MSTVHDVQSGKPLSLVELARPWHSQAHLLQDHVFPLPCTAAQAQAQLVQQLCVSPRLLLAAAHTFAHPAGSLAAPTG